MLGYHAQTETWGALFIILFVQFVSFGLLALSLLLVPPPELHAASVAASATADSAAIKAFFLTVFPSVVLLVGLLRLTQVKGSRMPFPNPL
jgi:hypothetical protein